MTGLLADSVRLQVNTLQREADRSHDGDVNSLDRGVHTVLSTGQW